MEVVVSAVTGILVALCAHGVLGSLGGRMPARAAGDMSSGALARHALRALGERVAWTSMVPDRAVRDVLVDVRGFKVAGHCPFAHLSDAEAGGVPVALSLLSAVLVGSVAGSAAIGAAGLVMPAAVLAFRVHRARGARARELEQAMPDAFGALAISLASGHSLPQAMRYVGNHADEPVKSEFMRVSFLVECGVPASEALDAMLSRLHAPGLELVVLALKVSQRTGSPLKDLLAEASRLVGDRIELRRRLDVKTSQARMSASMVACMPAAMVALLSLLSADFRRGVATGTGAVSVAIALLLNALAWSIIRRIMRIEV